MKRFIRPLAYGIVALLAINLAVIAITSMTGDDDPYEITAYFEKAIGLFPNSDVTILGVPVGKVTAVEPEGRRVRVEMELSKDYDVPADAFAQIVPISVISDRYIQLAPVYESGPKLADGAVLDVDRTQIPAELDDVFQQLKKLLDAIEPGRKGEPGVLGELVVALDDALRNRSQELRGTLITAADLTGTLAAAKQNLSGLLVNLDDLFARLATRASTFGTLNNNLATVMTALAESRADLEGTLANLAGLTGEVGRLVRDHRSRLGRDLAIAGRITSSILRHRPSVEQSLSWLPVVGKYLAKARHNGPVDSVDVRDDAVSGRCNEFETLPEAAQEALEPLFDRECGQKQPDPRPRTSRGAPGPARDAAGDLGCDRSVRRVQRQIRRLDEMTEIRADVRSEIVRPLRKQLRKVGRRCDEVAEAIDERNGFLEELLDDLAPGSPLPDPGEVQGGSTHDPLDVPTGNAAGGAAVPTPERGVWERLSGWFGGFVRFVGGER